MEIDQSKLWYQTNLDVFLNRWYSNYDDARKALENHGGFLLPYQNHFFVCQSDVISALGLDPDDPDWKKIGRDCAQPEDFDAFERLRQRRESLLRKSSNDQ